MSQQMIFVDRIAVGGVVSLSKEIGKIRHSTVTLLLTTVTEVLTDAHLYRGGKGILFKATISSKRVRLETFRTPKAPHLEV